MAAAHQQAQAHQPVWLHLLGYGAVAALAISVPVRRAVARGGAAVAMLALSFYGLQTFMGQIETAWFREAFALIDGAELALLMGLFGLQIAIPSAFFPPMVRLAHTLETASSTALYGALIGYALGARRSRTARGAPLELPSSGGGASDQAQRSSGP